MKIFELYLIFTLFLSIKVICFLPTLHKFESQKYGDLLQIEKSFEGITIHYHWKQNKDSYINIRTLVTGECKAKILYVKIYNQGDLQFHSIDQHFLGDLLIQKLIDTKFQVLSGKPNWSYQCNDKALYLDIYYIKNAQPLYQEIKLDNQDEQQIAISGFLSHNDDEKQQIVQIQKEEFNNLKEISILVIYKFKYNKMKAFYIQTNPQKLSQQGYDFLSPPAESYITESSIHNNRMQSVYLQFEKESQQDLEAQKNGYVEADIFMNEPMLFFVQVKLLEDNNKQSIQIDIYKVSSNMNKDQFEKQLESSCQPQDIPFMDSKVNLDIQLVLNSSTNKNFELILDNYTELITIKEEQNVQRKKLNKRIQQNNIQNINQDSENIDQQKVVNNTIQNPQQIQNETNQVSQQIQNKNDVPRSIKPQIQSRNKNPVSKNFSNRSNQKRGINKGSQRRVIRNPPQTIFPNRYPKRKKRISRQLIQEKIILERFLFSSLPLDIPQNLCSIPESSSKNKTFNLQVKIKSYPREQQTDYNKLQNYKPVITTQHKDVEKNLLNIAQKEDKRWIMINFVNSNQIQLQQTLDNNLIKVDCTNQSQSQNGEFQNFDQFININFQFFEIVDSYKLKIQRNSSGVFISNIYNNEQGFRESYDLQQIGKCQLSFENDVINIKLYHKNENIHKYNIEFEDETKLVSKIIDKDGNIICDCEKEGLQMKNDQIIYINYMQLQHGQEPKYLPVQNFNTKLSKGFTYFSDQIQQIKPNLCVFDTTIYDEFSYIEIGLFNQNAYTANYQYLKLYLVQDNLRVFHSMAVSEQQSENVYDLSSPQILNQNSINQQTIQNYQDIIVVTNFQEANGITRGALVDKYAKGMQQQKFYEMQKFLYFGFHNENNGFQMAIALIKKQLYFFITSMKQNQMQQWLALIYLKDNKTHKLYTNVYDISKNLLLKDNIVCKDYGTIIESELALSDKQEQLEFHTCYTQSKQENCEEFKSQTHSFIPRTNVIGMILVADDQNIIPNLTFNKTKQLKKKSSVLRNLFNYVQSDKII